MVNNSIIKHDALAATEKLCCKQNISTRVKRERLKKHELQVLDTDEPTVPCVVGGDVVSLF